MSHVVREEAIRVYAEVDQVYSRYIANLTRMVKALYREFQESLGPTDKVLLMESLPGPANLEFSKDGVKMSNGQVISAEEYVGRVIIYEGRLTEIEGILKIPDDCKFENLMLLMNQIEYYEKDTNKELTGKYLEEPKKQESSIMPEGTGA